MNNMRPKSMDLSALNKNNYNNYNYNNYDFNNGSSQFDLIQQHQNSIQERLKKELRIRDSALQLALAHTDKKSRDAALVQLDLASKETDKYTNELIKYIQHTYQNKIKELQMELDHSKEENSKLLMENVNSRSSSKNIKHLSKSNWNEIFNQSLKFKNSNLSLKEKGQENINQNSELSEKLKEKENAYQKLLKDYDDLKANYNNVKNEGNISRNADDTSSSLQNQILLLKNKCDKYENELTTNKNLNKDLSDQLKYAQSELKVQKEDFQHKSDNYEKRIKNYEIIVNKYRDDENSKEKSSNDQDENEKKIRAYYEKLLSEKVEQISSFRQKCHEFEDRISRQNEHLFKQSKEYNECTKELEKYKDGEKLLKKENNDLRHKIEDLKQENIQYRYNSYEKDSTINTLKERINTSEKDLKKAQSELLTTKTNLSHQLEIKEELDKKCKTQSFTIEKEKDRNLNYLSQIEKQKDRIADLEDRIMDLISEKEKQISEYEDKLKSADEKNKTLSNLNDEKINEYKEKYLSSQSTIDDLQKENDKLNKELEKEKENYQKLYSNNQLFLSSLSNKDENGKGDDDQRSIKSASNAHFSPSTSRKNSFVKLLSTIDMKIEQEDKKENKE